MLSLKLPFIGSNLAVLISRIGRGVFQPLPSRYSPGLRELVARMLRQVPMERPTIRQILLSPIIRGRLVSMVGSLTSRKMGQALPTAAAVAAAQVAESDTDGDSQQEQAGSALPVYHVDLSATSDAPTETAETPVDTSLEVEGKQVAADDGWGGGGMTFGQGAAYAAERARRLAAAVAARQDIARARRAAARAEQQADQAAAAQRWAAHEARERDAAASERAAWLARERRREAELEARAAVASMADARRRAAQQAQAAAHAQYSRGGGGDGSMAGRLAAKARQSEWEERRAVADRARLRAENGGGAPRSDRGGEYTPPSPHYAHGAADQAAVQRRHREQQRLRSAADRDAANREAAREAFFENKAIAARAAARANDQLGRQGSNGEEGRGRAVSEDEGGVGTPTRGGAERVREVQARRAAAKEAERAAHEAAVRAAITEQQAERMRLHKKRMSRDDMAAGGGVGYADGGALPTPPNESSNWKDAGDGKQADSDVHTGHAEGGGKDGSDEGGVGKDARPEEVLRALEEARAVYRAEKKRAEARAAAALLEGGGAKGGGDAVGGGVSHTRGSSSADLIVIPAGPLKARRKPPKLGAGRKRSSSKPSAKGQPAAPSKDADMCAANMATGPLQEAAARQLARVKAQPKRSSVSKGGAKQGARGSKGGSKQPATPHGLTSPSPAGADDDAAEEAVIELEVAVDGMRDELEAILAEAEGVQGGDEQRLLAAAGHDYDDTPPTPKYGVLGDDGDEGDEGQGGAAAAGGDSARHGALPPLPAPPSLSKTTSAGQDVERLRLYLEEYMGDMPFVKAYAAVRGSRATGGSPQDAVGAVLSAGGGRSGAASSALSGRFSDLILQLIQLEDGMVAARNKG